MSVVRCLFHLMAQMSRARQGIQLLRPPLLPPGQQSVYYAVIKTASHVPPPSLPGPLKCRLWRAVGRVEAEKVRRIGQMTLRILEAATVKHWVLLAERMTYQRRAVTKMVHRIEMAGKAWF